MLENARSQFALVLLSLLAGVLCLFFLRAQWGQDLKGGSQLRYEVPKDLLEKLTQKEGTTIDMVMSQSISVIADRIDPTGTIDAAVTRSGETGIMIELPYFDDPQELKRVQERVANLGKLEMRIVADGDYFRKATDTTPEFRFDIAAEKRRLEAWLGAPGSPNRQLLATDPRNISRFNDDPTQGPIRFGNLAWYPRLIGPSMENSALWDHPYSSMPLLSGSTVKAYDDKDYAGGVIPEEIKKKPKKEQVLLELVAINMHERFFSGQDLDPSGVSPTNGRNGGLAVAYKIVGEKSSDYADWSSDYINKCSAIILNGVIKSAPRFESRIPGEGQITGDFTNEEVDELVKVLRTGSLRVEPELQSKLIIGPTLGLEAIQRGLLSLATGGALVFVFMIWYYGVAGWIACATLLLNLFLLWSAMLFMQATITLPGLGGIVLTLGMAVDANVLIYERIREEKDHGKDMLRAVRAGFERAMSAILDSNVTSFLAGLVLFNIGTGPVRGFAVTLMAGIVTTVFTQFFVTRLAFHYALLKKWLDNWKPHSLLTGTNIDFVHYMKMNVTISIVMVIGSLLYAAFAPREQMLGMDFTGGANMQMVTSHPMHADEVRAMLAKDAAFLRDYPNISVNTIGEPDASGGSVQFNLKLKLTDSQRTAVETSRAQWREKRAQAEAAKAQPPAAFEPPYLERLRAIFADHLVKPAFSDPRMLPAPEANALEFAQINLHFQQPIKLAEASQKLLEARLPQATIRVPGDPNAVVAKDVLVEWRTTATTRQWELFDVARSALAGLKTADSKDLILSDPFPEAQEIQGRLVNDLRSAAIGALVLSWILIGLYLRVRFHDYSYGIAAVLSLIHDVAIAFGGVVIANHLGLVHAEINLNMIACFLTIIGYSVNDTIVIFDRIREVIRNNQRNGIVEPFREVINHAVNKTLSRTVLTHGVTMFVVLAQFFVNLGSQSDLESFAFGMIIGIVTGTYSSIFIAAPILIVLHKDELHAPAQPAVATPSA